MKVTVYFKGPDTSNDMVFTNATEACVTEHGDTLNVRQASELGKQPILSRIPIGNVSHWTVEQ